MSRNSRHCNYYYRYDIRFGLFYYGEGKFVCSTILCVCRWYAGLGASPDRPQSASGAELPLDSEESLRCCN